MGQVYQLKRDFPGLVVVINGGVTEAAQVTRHLSMVDGVMVGRAAYDSPWFLTQWDAIVQQTLHTTPLSPASTPPPHIPQHPSSLDRDAVEDAMVAYMRQQMATQPQPFHWKSIARHMLGLRNGQVSLESSFTRCNTVTPCAARGAALAPCMVRPFPAPPQPRARVASCQAGAAGGARARRPASVTFGVCDEPVARVNAQPPPPAAAAELTVVWALFYRF